MNILGLDISTTKIGYCISNNKQLIEYNYIDVEELSRDIEKESNTDYYYIFKKVDLVLPNIKEIIDEYEIKNIFIEKPNQAFVGGGSRMDVLTKLILFNYTISNELLKYTFQKPVHVDARSGRVLVFGKGFNNNKDNKLNKKIDIKVKVFDHLLMMYPELIDLKKYVNKNDKIQKYVYDITDSIVMSLYGGIKLSEK